jgi:predicted porin
MKKSLLLAALLGAVGVASAQNNVTIYGTVDAGIAYQRGAHDAGKTLTLESGQQSYSHIGFKGVEDLGGGMKALFLLEQAVRIDTGVSSFETLGVDTALSADSTGTFSSQAYVGLSSDKYGTVKLGRQFSPLFEAYAAIDPFQAGFASDINSVFGNYNYNSLYQRMSNAVTYHTPDIQGFKGALAVGFGESPASLRENSRVGVSLGYENGPLTIVYAYHYARENLFDKSLFKTNFIGAAYDFGMLKLHAAFDQNTAGGGSFKTQDYLLGVTVPFGAHAVFADYIRKKDKVHDDADAGQFGVGYTYNLSKRTNFYSAYTYVKNDQNSLLSTDKEGNSVNTFQIGMRHLF